ncbi:MAG: nickel pincer cofactor biosynthesis protein LarB [Chloroflexi bacterium]|nr:nickel pincer cofactor biosynthesis protein LarB [Chloroflexota bacterium]
MDSRQLTELLERVRRGDTTIAAALEELRSLPYQDLGFAKVDHHRALRRGFPEVVFGQGKSPEQIAQIAQELERQGQPLLVTRASEATFEAVHKVLPRARYHSLARCIVADTPARRPPQEGVSVICAGTADIPVAEEAALTAELMGNAVERMYDVGISGLHRLLDHVPRLQRARALVVVAGMEGALPSVVSGLVAAPVVAVPTSVGYGASFGGLAALLAMLNSCSAGVSVVNIDNGFGAGYLAGLINLGQQPGR